ncbi:MAG: thioredoxin [Bacteroidales bacterium]|nr:thioredoxin [Bacteroidales bacterium]
MEITVTDSNINEIISSSKLVMIDFWAPWCGPCRFMLPTVEQIASEWEGRAVIAKCNADECGDLAARMGIRNLPTLLFFKDGELVDRLVGAQTKAQIVTKLENL